MKSARKFQPEGKVGKRERRKKIRGENKDEDKI
jgi:hypothetical protein